MLGQFQSYPDGASIKTNLNRSFDEDIQVPLRPHALPVNHTLGVRGAGRYRNDIIAIHPSISLPVAMAIVPDCQRRAEPTAPKKPLDMNPVACTTPARSFDRDQTPLARVMAGKSRALWPWHRPKLRPTTGSNRTYFKTSSSPRRDWPHRTEKGPLSGWHLSCRALFWRHLTRLAELGDVIHDGTNRPVAESFQEATIFEGFLAIMPGRGLVVRIFVDRFNFNGTARANFES